jgi:hypothetical protein
MEQHDRPAEMTAQSAQDSLQTLQTLLEAGLEKVNLRIDHVYGKHDFDRVFGCPSCDAAG